MRVKDRAKARREMEAKQERERLIAEQLSLASVAEQNAAATVSSLQLFLFSLIASRRLLPDRPLRLARFDWHDLIGMFDWPNPVDLF